MNPLQYLPASFLLPAWTTRQLHRFAITYAFPESQNAFQQRQMSTGDSSTTNKTGPEEASQKVSLGVVRKLGGSYFRLSGITPSNKHGIQRGRTRHRVPSSDQPRLAVRLSRPVVGESTKFKESSGIDERVTAENSASHSYTVRKKRNHSQALESRVTDYTAPSRKTTRSVVVTDWRRDVRQESDQETSIDSQPLGAAAIAKTDAIRPGNPKEEKTAPSPLNTGGALSETDYVATVRKGAMTLDSKPSMFQHSTCRSPSTTFPLPEKPTPNKEQDGDKTRQSHLYRDDEGIGIRRPSQRNDTSKFKGAPVAFRAVNIDAAKPKLAEAVTFNNASYLKAIHRNAQIDSRKSTAGISALGLDDQPIDTKLDVRLEELPTIEEQVKEYAGMSQDAPETKNGKEGLSKFNPPRELSLMEELFPEIVNAAEGAKKEDVPMLSLPTIDSLEEEVVFGREDEILRPSTDEEILAASSKSESAVILVLEGANSDLTEDDFRRIATKGAHIDEWRGPANPTMIIPHREEESLAFMNRYLLVFKSYALAHIYRQRANRLHELAAKHTPTSVESLQMAPLPGTIVDGEDIYAVLKNYTLAPPSQPLYLRFLQMPYHKDIQRILAAAGIPGLRNPVDRTRRSVILRVDGHTASIFDIKDMLLADGEVRGVHWSPALRNDAIEQLSGSQPLQAFRGVETHDQDDEWSEGSERAAADGRRWLVTFEDETEARRFVRAWHEQPLHGWEKHAPKHDLEAWPVLKVELVW